MTDDLIRIAIVVAAVGCGLSAGVMLAFSTSVMPALARRPADQAIAAMQAMNEVILNPVFGLVFGGTSIVCLGLALTAPFTTEHGNAGWRALGALLFVAGELLLTMVVNVPLNETLAGADPASVEGQRLWARYLDRWTAWNHVRTLAGAAASTALILAL